MKMLNKFINFLVVITIGFFAGFSIYTCWNYKNNIEVYEAYSAPWYIGIEAMGGLVVVILITCLVTKFIIKRNKE